MKKILIIILVIFAGVFIIGSIIRDKEENKTPQEVSLLKGVSVSPISFTGDGFVEFLEKVKETQDVLVWAGDWMEVQDKKAPKTFSELAAHYDYMPIIEVGHWIQESGDLFRPLTKENKQIYKDSTIEFVKKYEPKNLCRYR